MQRGKVIGAIVLIAAIGIIVARFPSQGDRAGDESDRTSSSSPAPASREGGATATGLSSTAAGSVAEGLREYRVDAAGSEVYWRIYKAGAMARLGHNHVISMVSFTGSILLGDDPAAAQWDLQFPVADLVIDDPALRSRYGEDFASVPSENDKAGTKTNMLKEEVLNGAEFPVISLQGTGFSGTLAAAELPMTISMLGRTINQVFPASISIEADSIIVTGEYSLTHADLGLTPFVAVPGLLSVGDAIDFTYRIRAVAVD